MSGEDAGRPSRLRLPVGTGLLAVFAAAYLICGAVVVTVVHDQMRSAALDDARARAQIIASRDLATHMYFTEQLKPPLFELIEDTVDDEYFDPAWMSSSHAVRVIDDYFDELSDTDYHVKDAAIDARSPDNEADAFEAEFLGRLAEDPELKGWSGVREYEDGPHFVVLERGETMSEPCLRCHGEPADAPQGLVARYGPDRAFGREVGSVASVISVSVPLAVPYAEAQQTALRVSGVVLATMLLGFVMVYWWANRRVIAPLRSLTSQIEQGNPLSEEGAVSIVRPAAREVAVLAQAYADVSSEVERNLARLEHSNEELRRTGRAREVLFQELSHDLRTPLNSIIGFTGIMLQGHAGPVNEEQRRQLEMIKASGENLLGRFEHALDTSHGASSLDPSRDYFDLVSVVRRAVDPLGELAAGKGLTLSVESESRDPVDVSADAAVVERIVAELVDNAIRFTEHGGVSVVVESSRPYAAVVVSDTGPGIPDEKLDRAFNAFQPLSTEHEDEAHFGLAAVRRDIARIGGRLEDRSGETGTSLAILVPREVERQADGSPQS